MTQRMHTHHHICLDPVWKPVSWSLWNPGKGFYTCYSKRMNLWKILAGNLSSLRTTSSCKLKAQHFNPRGSNPRVVATQSSACPLDSRSPRCCPHVSRLTCWNLTVWTIHKLIIWIPVGLTEADPECWGAEFLVSRGLPWNLDSEILSLRILSLSYEEFTRLAENRLAQNTLNKWCKVI